MLKTRLETLGPVLEKQETFFTKVRHFGNFNFINILQKRVYVEKKKNKNSSNDASYKKHQIDTQEACRTSFDSQSNILTFLKQEVLKKLSNNCLYNKS